MRGDGGVGGHKVESRTIFRGGHFERLAAGQHIVHALDTRVRPLGNGGAHARDPSTNHLLQTEKKYEEAQRREACDADEVNAQDDAENEDVGRRKPQHVKEGVGHLEALDVDGDEVCRLPCGRL